MILCGDALTELRKLPDESVNCCVTSPPYWGLRDYGVPGQLGLEETPEEYVAHMVEVFCEVRRVLRSDGTLWLNLGDSYAANGARRNNNGEGASTMGWPGQRKETLNKAAKMVLPAVHSGLKPKDLVGIPWRVAFALQSDGWWLRQDIIWAKPNPMPESVRDRCTKAHEYIFMLTKSAKYWYDAEAIWEPAIYGEEHANKATSWGTNRKHPNKANVAQYAFVGENHTCHIKADKQRGHSRRHAGFNDRWDAMSKEEQCSYMRNKRSVWTIATRPYAEAHFATFPPEIPELCIKAGCPKGGKVLDPFFGAGTTGLVAMRLGREFIGVDLSPAYCEMARKRIYGTLMEAQL